MQPTIKIIGLKALRNNIAKVTQSVAEGNEYIVIKHSKLAELIIKGR